jgi:hypothetical protein
MFGRYHVHVVRYFKIVMIGPIEESKIIQFFIELHAGSPVFKTFSVPSNIVAKQKLQQNGKNVTTR